APTSRTVMPSSTPRSCITWYGRRAPSRSLSSAGRDSAASLSMKSGATASALVASPDRHIKSVVFLIADNIFSFPPGRSIGSGLRVRQKTPLVAGGLDEVAHSRVALVARVLEKLILRIEEHRIADRPF